jgi:hypothetical protein
MHEVEEAEGKVTVILPRCLIKNHVMNRYKGMEILLHAFFKSTLDVGGQLYVPVAFPPVK